ncbi:MAG TPA: OsmC family protein [Cyclobacteriaceae bacterium]|nr:OsmC family protein [Cyclobacteriaceae bacterium]
MATRHASAQWNGTLKEGNGKMRYGNYEGNYSFSSRFEEGPGTNPEELVGAAISGCYSMFLSALLSGENLKPERIETTATIQLERDDRGPIITKIDLDCKAKVANISKAEFLKHAGKAKENCPISRLYQGTTINLKAELVG